MEINKQKLPTSVKEKSLNGIIEKKQETLSKAKRITWGVLALVILSAFLAVFWCLIINEPKENLPIDITEQVAIKIANQFLQQKCDVNFIGIEKGPLAYVVAEICHGLADYTSKYSEIWTITYSLQSSLEEDKSRSIAVLVGLDGNFVCGYAIDSRAAPGILNLDEACGKKVVVATDKTEYEQGEAVKITLKNNLDRKICLENCNTYYLEKKNTEWKTDFESIKFCEDNFIKECLGPRETKIFELKTSWDSYKKERGTYRVVIPLYTEDFKEDQTVYSSEFTIKEKSMVNPRCGQKVKITGVCEGKLIDDIGYQFNSEIGKCIEKAVGGTGCRVESPFTSLEECQKVCEENQRLPVGNESKYCNTADDCVPVGCSCHCSGCGGFSYEDIVNKNYVQAWYDEHNCSPATECPMVCCELTKIICEDNICKVKSEI